MSSTWYIYCLGHNPATQITGHSAASLAVDRIVEGFEDHPHCDFVIIRVSGGPVEVGCSGKTDVCSHTEPEWVDVDWLKLLRYFDVIEDDDLELARLRNRHTMKHWTPERLHRLRYAL